MPLLTRSRRTHMNQSQMIEKVSQQAGITKAAAQAAVKSFLSTVTDEVKKGKSVTLTGFGTFDRATRKARVARNPQTGEKVKVPRTNVPRFRAGATFKNTVKSLKAALKKVASKKVSVAMKPVAKKAVAVKPVAKKASKKKAVAKKASMKKSIAKKVVKKATKKVTKAKSIKKK